MAFVRVYIVPRTGVFTTYTMLTQAYAYSGHQSWTEISNANFFIRIVPSSSAFARG